MVRKVALECAKRRAPCVVEAPVGSALWRDTDIGVPGGAQATFDVCAFGAKPRRRSRLLMLNVDWWDVKQFNYPPHRNPDLEGFEGLLKSVFKSIVAWVPFLFEGFRRGRRGRGGGKLT